MFDFSSLIGPGVDFISNLFGGGRGGDTARGYEDYRRALEEYGRRANEQLAPWQRAGASEIPGYQQNYQRLMTPDFLKQIMGEWQMSPYAKLQQQKGEQAINNAASASGMLGSSDFGKDQADYARQITSADQQQYLNNRLGMYNAGIGHQGGMVNQGLGAASQMSQNYMNLGDAIGRAMQGQAHGEGQRRDDIFRGIGGIGRSIFDYLSGSDNASNEMPGTKRLPVPQFRRYG